MSVSRIRILPILSLLFLSISCFDGLGRLADEPRQIDTPQTPSISFSADADRDEDQISGVLSVVEPEHSDDIKLYKIYWGNSSGEKLDLICELVKGENLPEYTFPENSAVPPGATQFIAYSVNNNNQISEPAAIDIEDVAVKLVSQTCYAGENSNSKTYMAVFKDKLYFNGGYPETGTGNGVELWSYDGESEPVQVVDINDTTNSRPAHLYQFKNKLYFKARGNNNAGDELWSYDGKTASMEYNIAAGNDVYGVPNNSNPSFLTEYKGSLYFSANIVNHGVELIVYDGKKTFAIASEIVDGTAGSNPSYMTVYKGNLYFQANTTYDGKEIWMFDGIGSTMKTVMPGVFDPAFMIEYKGEILFSALIDSTKGIELSSYDGETVPKVKYDIALGAASSEPKYLTVYNGKLYFQANGNNGRGKELWCYDGNKAYMAADILSGSAGSEPEGLTVYKGKLYFSAYTSSGERKLWVYSNKKIQNL